MRFRGARFATIVALVCGASALAPLAAGGTPIDDKRAQAQRLQAEIDANGAKLDALSEQYHGVEYKLAQIDADITSATAAIAQAQHRFDGVQREVGKRAAALYMSAGTGNPLAAVDVRSLGDLAARSQYTAALTSRDDALLADLRSSKEDLQSRRSRLDHDRTQARAQRDRLASTRAEINGATTREQALLSQTKTDLAKLVEQYRKQAAAAAARVEAAARAARQAQAAASHAQASRSSTRPGAARGEQASPSAHSSFGSDSSGSDSSGVSVAIPPTSGGAMVAVNFALAQVGKPYVFDAAGPGSYDCSGLTMAAWAAAGVSMPHYSGAQYEMFPHVPVSQARPGDLLFRGAGGSQHVEIYIGNGMVVTAPHTGDFVKVAPMGHVLPMAARP
jgi:cell wall-associated NlpC family hydrolase